MASWPSNRTKSQIMVVCRTIIKITVNYLYSKYQLLLGILQIQSYSHTHHFQKSTMEQTVMSYETRPLSSLMEFYNMIDNCFGDIDLRS